MRYLTTAFRLSAAAALLFSFASVARGQDDERELGWAFQAEFSGVWAGGNQETFSLGLDAKADYLWPRSNLQVKAGGVNTESSLTTRRAVGTGQDDFLLVKETSRDKTAEAYYARGTYEYDVSDRFFFLGGADWLRNTFAGIDSRFLLAAGAGNTWSDSERLSFKTGYALTYTFQEDVVDNPILNSTFPGLRLSYDLLWKLTASTDFESNLIGDWNLDTTDDIRVEWKNALPIAISSRLAFKPSLRLLWRNDPSLTEVPLFDADGTDTGETVLTPLEKLDTFFTLALVVTL